MNTPQMIAIVKGRQALFAAANEAGEANGATMQALAYALIEVERLYPAIQAEAFSALAGPREEWEIA